MAFKSSLKLDSKFFNKQAREQAFGSATINSAQEFRQSLKQKMIDSEPSGRRETIGETASFRATFRRSKRGQRPAIQTRYLLNSIYARRVSVSSAITEVTAEYADELQNILARQIMTAADVKEAEAAFNAKLQRTLIDLI